MEVLMLGNGFDLGNGLMTKYHHFLMIIDELTRIDTDNLDTYRKLIDAIVNAPRNRAIQDLEEACLRLSGQNKALSRFDFLFSFKQTYSECMEYPLDNNALCEMVKKAEGNIWFAYFEKQSKKCETWIDIEKMTKEGLSYYNKKYESIFSKSYRNTKDAFAEFNKREKECESKEIELFINQIISNSLFKSKFTSNILHEILWLQYQEFIEIFKIYLKIFVEDILDITSKRYRKEISFLYEAKPRYVLNFNYTHTFEKLNLDFNLQTQVIHIHGDTSGPIVMGIDPNGKDDGDDDLAVINFKKYYQRTVNHTEQEFAKLYSKAKQYKETNHKNTLRIIGHSLDKTDKDIITLLFPLFDEIYVYYHDIFAFDSLIKNLIKIFGADQYNKMKLSGQLKFYNIPEEPYKAYCIN